MSEPKRKASEAYLAKLRDPRWQKKRLEVFNRDAWTCKYCGDTKTSLQVHHKAYQKGKEPWDYPMDWLITACETCHEKQPRDISAEEMELLSALRQKGFQAYETKLLADAFRDATAYNGPPPAVHYASIVYLTLAYPEAQREAYDAAVAAMEASKAPTPATEEVNG